jgi:methyltransferase (TIGR00027 family)
VKDGTASRTARGVAAHRLGYERVETPYGDPAADDALTRDVADGRDRSPGTPIDDYLRARTAFFDDATVRAIDAGISQVVVGAAGYDGRAMRYAKPGVRWFEVDHPDTQADKLERLARLGLDTGHIRFIPADFATDPITEPLLDAGLDAGIPALFLLEGIAVYLDPPTLTRVLRAFRSAAAAGSLLAISFSVGRASAERRQRFQDRVAEIGEPVRTVLAADAAGDLLVSAGWAPAQPRPGGRGEGQRSAGLLLAHARSAFTAGAI